MPHSRFRLHFEHLLLFPVLLLGRPSWQVARGTPQTPPRSKLAGSPPGTSSSIQEPGQQYRRPKPRHASCFLTLSSLDPAAAVRASTSGDCTAVCPRQCHHRSACTQNKQQVMFLASFDSVHQPSICVCTLHRCVVLVERMPWMHGVKALGENMQPSASFYSPQQVLNYVWNTIYCQSKNQHEHARPWSHAPATHYRHPSHHVHTALK